MHSTPELTVLRFDYKPEIRSRIQDYGNQIPRGVSNEVRLLLEGVGIFCENHDIQVSRNNVEVVVPIPANHFDQETLGAMGEGILEQQPILLSPEGIRALVKAHRLTEKN